MRVRTVGLEWEVGNQLSIDDFFAHLVSESGDKFEYDGKERLLFIGHSSNFHVAMLITSKDQGGICELVEKDGQYTFDFRELDGDRSLMDFNFLAMNSSSQKGVYTHYHQSCSPHAFGDLMRRRYVGAAYPNQRPPADSFRQRLIVREKAFIALVAELESISNVEFDLGVVRPRSGEFSPFEETAKRLRHKVTFKRKVTLSERIRSIESLFDSSASEEIAVYGRDASGFRRIVRLMDNPDVFDECDYDDLARKISRITGQGFSRSAIVSRLIDVANSNQMVLGKTP